MAGKVLHGLPKQIYLLYADYPILKPQSTDPEKSVFGSSIHIEEPTEEEYDALDQAIFSFIGRLHEDYINSLCED